MSIEYSYPKFGPVPKLVEDKTLKRSRVDITDDTSAIRVTSTANVDLTTVNTNTDTLVTTTDTINTAVGTINSTQGSVSDAAWSGTGDATVISLLKGIVNKFN